MDAKESSFVCIEEEEFERLKDNDILLINYQDDKLAKINLKINEEINYKLNKIQKRQIEYERFVYGLNGDIKYLEIQNQNSIKSQNEKFRLLRNEYYKLIQEERNEYLNLFEKHEEEFSKLIETEKYNRIKSIEIIDDKVKFIISENIKKKDRVSIFVFELIRIFDQIDNIPHQIFAKNQFEILKNNLTEILEDIEMGYFENSFNNARNLYKRLFELKEFVLKKEQEYLIMYYAVVKEINLFRQKIKTNKNLKFSMNIIIDSNYWSYGSLNILEKEINNIESKFDKDNFITFVDMEKIVKLIKEKKSEFELIVKKSKNNIILSQIRFSIAKKILSKLKKYLFFVVDSGYTNNDQRSNYFIELKNMIGDNISVIIKKNEKDHISEIIINSNNDNYKSKSFKDFLCK